MFQSLQPFMKKAIWILDLQWVDLLSTCSSLFCYHLAFGYIWKEEVDGDAWAHTVFKYETLKSMSA